MQVVDLKGEKMPKLGFGTWQLKGAECAPSIKLALETGYRHIDTAQVYDNEAEVGEGLKGFAREQIFLTTKVWRGPFAENKVMASVDESLKKLKTDYVDLLLVHWPFPETPVARMVEEIMKVQEAGKTRLIGVSNFTVAQMEEALKVSGGKVCCNQVEYHPHLSQKPVLDCARQNGMVMTAYSPIGRGRALKDPVIMEMGLKHGKSAAQVTLRWLMQQDSVAAIPKSATPGNIKSNLDIFDFELSEAEMKEISALAKADVRIVNPDGIAPKWDQAA